MSLGEFKYLVKEGICDNVMKYVDDNKEKLLMINKSNLFGTLLKMVLHKNIKYFAESKFKWEKIEFIYDPSRKNAYRFSWVDVTLHQNDLTTRMNGLKNINLYISILRAFLVNHDVSEIPESFIMHFDNEFNSLLMEKLHRLFFTTLKISLNDIINHNININTKMIEVYCLFMTYRYNDFASNVIMCWYGEKTDSESQNFFGIEKVTKVPNYDCVNCNLINSDNIIDVLSDILQKQDKHFLHNECTNVNSKNITDYLIDVSSMFNYMTLSEHVAFWNMLPNDKILDIMMVSHSKMFINYCFDRLHIFSDIDAIMNKKINFYCSYKFWKILIQRFSKLKEHVLINLFLYDIEAFVLVFNDIMTVQEMIQILKNYL